MGRVFVVGNVKRPGAFSLRDAEEGTVLQMVAVCWALLKLPSGWLNWFALGAAGLQAGRFCDLDFA